MADQFEIPQSEGHLEGERPPAETYEGEPEIVDEIEED